MGLTIVKSVSGLTLLSSPLSSFNSLSLYITLYITLSAGTRRRSHGGNCVKTTSFTKQVPFFILLSRDLSKFLHFLGLGKGFSPLTTSSIRRSKALILYYLRSKLLIVPKVLKAGIICLTCLPSISKETSPPRRVVSLKSQNSCLCSTSTISFLKIIYYLVQFWRKLLTKIHNEPRAEF